MHTPTLSSSINSFVTIFRVTPCATEMTRKHSLALLGKSQKKFNIVSAYQISGQNDQLTINVAVTQQGMCYRELCIIIHCRKRVRVTICQNKQN